MTASTKTSPTKVITGECRLSFANLFEAKANKEGDKKQFSCMLLIPKTDTKTIAAIHAAQKAALEAKLGEGKGGDGKGKLPPGWKNTFRDGDDEKDLDEFPEYAGMMFLNVSANEAYPPGLVDRQLNPIIDRKDLYSGCYVRVQLNAYAFDVDKSKGVSFGLRNVQKLRDGEPFGDGGEKAEDVFEALPDDADDSMI